MDEMNESNEVLEIDLMKYVRLVLRHWKRIVLWALVAGAAGIVLSFGIPREYKVVSKVAPELSLRTNSLTSLASMAGLSLNMLSNNNDALLPTIYPEIVGSVPFVTDLFQMRVRDSTLYNYFLNDVKSSWISALLSLPFKAIGAVFQKENEQQDTLDVFHLTKEQNRVYKMIRNSIKLEVDKKTFLVTVTVTAQDPQIAANLNAAVIVNLKKYVTEYRTGKARKNADFLMQAYENAKEDYYTAQKRYALYSDAHQEMMGRSSMIEKQRLQNESNLAFQLYSSLAQQYQQAIVSVEQESPVFAEVVPPTVPLRKSSPHRVRIAIVFMLLGAAASLIHIARKTPDNI